MGWDVEVDITSTEDIPKATKLKFTLLLCSYNLNPIEREEDTGASDLFQVAEPRSWLALLLCT